MTSARGQVRDRLIARLRDGRADSLLDPEGEDDAAALLRVELHAVLADEPDGPAYCMEAFAVLGWLFWNRHLAAGARDERDLLLAMLLFTPLAADGTLVPEVLLSELPREAPGRPSVGAWNDMVGEIVVGRIGLDDRTALLAGAAVLVMGLGMSPPGGEMRWRFQDNLIYLLSLLFEAHGDDKALTKAVELARWSVEQTDPGSSRRLPGFRRLVETLALVHDAIGDRQALADAIQNTRTAMGTLPPDHEELADWTNILAGLLASRHTAALDTASLDEAIAMLRSLLDELPPEHPAHAATTGHLAVALGQRHHLSPGTADPGKVADLCRSSLDGIPVGHPIRPRVLAALTEALILLARRTVSTRDLDDATDAARQAVAEVPPGKRVPGQVLQTLAAVLVARQELFDDLAAFDEAIAILERGASEAVNEVEQANLRFMLAALWNNRYAATRDPDHARMAVTALQTAMATPGCSARQRVRAAVSAAEVLGDLGDWGGATALMSTAVGSLSTLAGRHLSLGDRQSALSEFSTTPVRAASYAIEAGQPERALELLEHGRGVLFSESAALRDGVGELRARAPSLASALTRVTAELDATTDSDSRHRFDRDRQRLIDQVRELDGFEDFLKPLRLREILDACRSGPVVLPLAARERLDALIVTRDGVRHVSLPRQDMGSFRTAMRRLFEAVDIATSGPKDLRPRGEDLLQLSLEWLWETITGPVLDDLGLTGERDGQEPPRVWWCPTGPLSYVPLHAAGRRGGPYALDHAVFSYTPSIRTLSRTHPWRLREDSSPLAVGLSRTPGLADLPAVEQELALIAGMFPRCRILRNAAATRGQVIAALPAHDIAHLACHGGDNPDDHHQGQLFLHDGTLGFADLARLRTDRGTLAFLSACTTARPALDLPDEALSVALGFQLAGFSDVVASLWPIDDQEALQLSSDFYTHLLAGTSSAASALHHAVRNLRERESGRPSLWAPYLHLGA